MVELDVRLVRSFVAVAEAASFTRAAEQLHVAQPWLSVQIRKLEEQLGFRLFERNRNRAVIISPQGEALLPAAREYLQSVELIAGSARRIRDQAGHKVRMGAPDFTAEMPMRNAIFDALLVERPGLELEVTNAWTVELLKLLHDGDLDAAFTVGPHVEQWCEALVVARYRLALLARADDFGDASQPLKLAQLAGREVAIFRRNVNAPFHDSIAPVLQGAGVQVAQLTEPSLLATFHYTLRTGLPALIGGYTLKAAIPVGLILLEVEEPQLWFNLNLVRRVGDRRPAVAALWAAAMRIISD